MKVPHDASVSGLFSGVLDIAKVYRPLGEVVVGDAGHGAVHLLVQSAGTIGFAWDPVECVWVRPGLRMLCHLASLIKYSKGAVRDAWSAKVAQDLSWFSEWEFP